MSNRTDDTPIEDSAPPSKACVECGDVLPATTKYFYKSKGCRYNVSTRCRTCIERERLANIEKYGRAEISPEDKCAEVRETAKQTPRDGYYETPAKKWALEPNQILVYGYMVRGRCKVCERMYPANTYYWRLNRQTGTFGDTCLSCRQQMRAEKRAAKVASE